MKDSHMTVFLTIVLSVWAAMHAYVFWRLGSVPWVAAHVSRLILIGSAVVLWASYLLARILGSLKLDPVALPLEFAAATWIGFLLLLFSCLLVTDAVTLGGWLLPRLAPTLRSWATGVAGVLSIIALIQGLRPPVVRDYEVQLAELPPERDGLTLVAISDLHLGTLIGRQWLARLISRINELRPDLVVIVGDLLDGNVQRAEPLLPVLRELRAPLGVWTVTGNHEYYAGIERSVRLIEEAGYTVLRDCSAEVIPGLVLAGVDDLTARRQFGIGGRRVTTALANRRAGATIFLSHTPWETKTAAAAGAGLMLSGHTHNGQIWPFKFLVATRYPLMAGRCEIDGMPVIVCRGTGTWGPRMRLWRPGEMLRVRLRVPMKAPRQ